MRQLEPKGRAERILEEAYGAILEPARWVAMLETYSDVVGADKAALHAPPEPGETGRIFVAHNIDPGTLIAQMETSGRRALFTDRAIGRGLAPGVFLHHDVIPYEEIHATDYYAEYMRPLDIEHGMSSILRLQAGMPPRPVSLTVLRGRAARPFEDRALRIARAVFPHIRRAVALTLDVGPERMVEPGLTDALEHFTTPCCLLGAGGRVMFVNAAARGALSGDATLEIREHRLTSSLPEVDRQLQTAVAAVCEFSALWSARAASEIVAPRRSGPPRAVVITPLGEDNPFAGAGVGPVRAAVYLLDGAMRNRTTAARRLRLMFGLTPAEAQVAAALIQGHSIATVAEQRGVARSTVEGQAKVILGKTQSPRIVDLVRLRDLLLISA